MNPRVDEELALLKNWFGDRLEYLPEGHWVKVRNYWIPPNIWAPNTVELSFQIPDGIPGQAPYSFHVRPGVALISAGPPNNYTYPTTNPWGDGWGTFSWAIEDWRPGAAACDGSNMLDFARSIADRFREGA